MASIHKTPKSKFWYAAWRTAEGRLILRSTKHTDRAEALNFALLCERAEKAGSAGTLTEVQARKIITEIAERTSQVTLRNPSMAEWFKGWLASKEARKSESTARVYSAVIGNFLEHLGDRAKRPLQNLVPRDIADWITEREEEVSPATAAMNGRIIRAALNQARREGIITTNPAEAVELPEGKGITREIFTPTEIALLVQAAEGEWKTLILLGYYLGARLVDCTMLRWTEIDLVARTMAHTQKKGGKRVMIPLHSQLHAHLEDLAGKADDNAGQFILPALAQAVASGRNGLSLAFKAIVLKAGLDLMTVKGAGGRQQARRTFHSLRHSFTSALANAGVSAEDRMAFTGHSSTKVHGGYTHHDKERMRGQIEKISGLGLNVARA